MKSELIISTYNSPRALVLTLLSVTKQRVQPDSVCIADDGSGQETRDAIADFQARFPSLPIRHVWHPDNGFEKNVILNQAVATSDADYLIFIDGDCLIDPVFVARHLEVARPDRFCSGSLIRLDDPTTQAVTEDDVLEGRVFDIAWLKKTGTLRRFTTWLKAGALPKPVLAALEHIYPVGRNWCGGNGSAFRDAIIKVNGLDEDMKYGGGDKEFGIRLANSGVKGRHLRFTAPLVHLDHPRGYKDPEKIKAHRLKIDHARKTGKIWAEAGISGHQVSA
ncbi:glycosyltransferase [Actibacterium lipolyticum]|uniref:Chondroitin synthase n=1 Tax=Actibacterium lipolyticum TaxID=1524263 RepID=A0A238KJL3_9RHOB|nr:glycosyltransferase [Actibacterium lipolyticum]SMX42847.1 Chondroitin synthase [Actibacterium lipolyticum]